MTLKKTFSASLEGVLHPNDPSIRLGIGIVRVVLVRDEKLGKSQAAEKDQSTSFHRTTPREFLVTSLLDFTIAMSLAEQAL